MGECKCATNPDVLFTIASEAENCAAEFINNFSDGCAELAKVAVGEYVGRLVHVLVMLEEMESNCSGLNLESMQNTPETHAKVQRRMMEIASGILPVIAKIMSDKEVEKSSARH